MILRFIDVFRFFAEIELTDTQRRYELIAVSCVCAVMAVVTVILIIRNKRKSSETEK